MTKQYILNRETNKIELQFSKPEYQALSASDKSELRSAFLFAGSRSVWVSRSSSNHFSAIRTAKKLGFVDGGNVGERLTYAEQVERQQEKAEARAERFEQYADNAEKRAEGLQKEWKEASKDWSFVTQPNINSSAGRAFTNRRQHILDRYAKGFDEYRKSEYFRNRSITAQETASMSKYNNRTYLSNRIEECNKEIRAIERLIVQAEERNNEEWLSRLLDRMEQEMDKLAYMLNCLDAIGGVQYSKDNVKAGYLVKIRGRDWQKVVKANPKTVEVQPSSVPYTLKYPYAEIQEMKIPEGWEEIKKETVNPFEVGDILVRQFHNGYVSKAFQVVKTTDKSVTIQEIHVIDNVPQFDQFASDKQERRNVKETRGAFVVNYDDWYLYKYNKAA